LLFWNPSPHPPIFDLFTLKMLGCFNPILGQIWTNPAIWSHFLITFLTQCLSLSIFDPQLGLNNPAFFRVAFQLWYYRNMIQIQQICNTTLAVVISHKEGWINSSALRVQLDIQWEECRLIYPMEIIWKVGVTWMEPEWMQVCNNGHNVILDEIRFMICWLFHFWFSAVLEKHNMRDVL